MWSIPRTLTKFWVSGHLKIRWVLDGYSGRFWGDSGGGSWESKSIKLVLKGQYVRKNVFLETFLAWWKQHVNLRCHLESTSRRETLKLEPWGEGREGGTEEDCLTNTSKPHQPMKGWWDYKSLCPEASKSLVLHSENQFFLKEKSLVRWSCTARTTFFNEK